MVRIALTCPLHVTRRASTAHTPRRSHVHICPCQEGRQMLQWHHPHEPQGSGALLARTLCRVSHMVSIGRACDIFSPPQPPTAPLGADMRIMRFFSPEALHKCTLSSTSNKHVACRPCSLGAHALPPCCHVMIVCCLFALLICISRSVASASALRPGTQQPNIVPP